MGKVVNGVYQSDTPNLTEKQRVEEAMQYYGQNGMTGELNAAWNYYQTLGDTSAPTSQSSGSVVTPVVTDKVDQYNMNPSVQQAGGAMGQGGGQAMTSYLNSINGSWGYDPNSNSVIVNGKKYDWNGSGYGIPGVTWNPSLNLNYISDPQSFLAGTGLSGLVQANQTNSLLQSLLNQAPMSAQEMQSMLMGMVQQPEWAQGISYDEGMKRAGAALTPKYELSMKDVLQKLAGNQVSRGFYGQLPADVVTQDAAARLEAEKNAAIAAEANALVSQAAQEAYQQNSLNQNMYSTNLSAALQMIQAQQAAQQDRLTGLLSLLGIQNNQTNSLGQMNLDTTKTITAMNSDAMNNALARWQTSGVITNQADADLLGVPVGTKTSDQAYRDASLALSARSGGNTGSIDNATDYSEAIASMIGNVVSGAVPAAQAMAWADAMYASGKIDANQYNQIAKVAAPSSSPPEASSGVSGGLGRFLSLLGQNAKKANSFIDLMPTF